jgi:phosphoribosylformylglycinamidine synthase
MPVYKIFVEKKPEFANEAGAVAADLRGGPRLNVSAVRVVNRYFVEDISEKDFEAAKNTIFSEPPVDIIYEGLPEFGDARVFAAEYLPGQFDQRADSCAQCVSLATGAERPLIRTAKIYAIYGGLTDEEFAKAKAWLINPVESREAGFGTPETLAAKTPAPEDTETISGFISMGTTALEELCKGMGLAMDIQDLLFCRGYFKDEEKRDPTVTELRVLDTYWSDHCRHTTFLTELDKVEALDTEIQKAGKAT